MTTLFYAMGILGLLACIFAKKIVPEKTGPALIGGIVLMGIGAAGLFFYDGSATTYDTSSLDSAEGQVIGRVLKQNGSDSKVLVLCLDKKSSMFDRLVSGLKKSGIPGDSIVVDTYTNDGAPLPIYSVTQEMIGDAISRTDGVTAVVASTHGITYQLIRQNDKIRFALLGNMNAELDSAFADGYRLMVCSRKGTNTHPNLTGSLDEITKNNLVIITSDNYKDLIP